MVISSDYRFVSVLPDAGRFKDVKYFDHCEEICICNTPGEYEGLPALGSDPRNRRCRRHGRLTNREACLSNSVTVGSSCQFYCW